jgi:hypothetical protein
MRKNKRGVFNQLSALGIGVAALVITLAVVFLILSQVGSNTQVVADANATAAVNTLTNAAATIPNWVPLVILVAIGGLILGLVALFGARR